MKNYTIKKNKKKYKKNKKKYTKNKKKFNRLGKGTRYCDYTVGNCQYSSWEQFNNRYKAHKTLCPTLNAGPCVHISIEDTWNPHLKHWHFGKKRDRNCNCTEFIEPKEYEVEDPDQWDEIFHIYNDMTDGLQRYSNWHNMN